jgi:hypothetical protein
LPLGYKRQDPRQFALSLQIPEHVPGQGIFTIVSGHPALALDLDYLTEQLGVWPVRPKKIILFAGILEGGGGYVYFVLRTLKLRQSLK